MRGQAWRVASSPQRASASGGAAPRPPSPPRGVRPLPLLSPALTDLPPRGVAMESLRFKDLTAGRPVPEEAHHDTPMAECAVLHGTPVQRHLAMSTLLGAHDGVNGGVPRAGERRGLPGAGQGGAHSGRGPAGFIAIILTAI